MFFECVRIQTCANMIGCAAGEKYNKPPVINFEAIFETSSPNVPIVFILSPGTEPANDLMKLADQVERDFDPVGPDNTLGELVQVVSRSRRNIHPVLDASHTLVGIVPLEEIRGVMFDPTRYHSLTVRDLMVVPPAILDMGQNMEAVMDTFDRTGAWNLPVVEQGRYLGFVSRSNLFGAYRAWLQEVSEDGSR